MEDSIRVRSENCGGGAKIGDNSFTALLELPPNQAVQLLVHEPYCPPPPPIIFPSDTALIDRASKFSVFAAAAAGKLTADTSSFPSNSSLKSEFVKREPVDNDDSESNPTVSLKRKEHEKKGKESSSKKSKKSANDTTEDGENLPYVHVRARRGQATDSHSLAERARREKINARMKLLQELVPGCNKISGTAMVLDEIINHVQTLQRQVEFLSMRLAAVNPRIDFNLDSLFAAEQSGSAVESNFTGIVVPPTWPEGQSSGNRNHYQQLLQIDGFNQPVWIREDDSRLITPENSLLTYDSSANSASLHQNQLKMELQM